MKKGEYESFFVSIRKDKALKALRQKYAKATPEERRMAAQWEYDSEAASDIFNVFLVAWGNDSPPEPKWPAGFLPLAIDPLHAPALLTVGSMEYQYGYEREAMKLFLKLTALPRDVEDLAVIIDKAGDFLLDQEDPENALELYLAAERAYPDQAVYPAESGYCFYQLGNIEEAVRKAHRAVELEPYNYCYVNDLGFALLEAGALEEAEEALKRAISLAPSDDSLPQHNLEELHERKKARCEPLAGDYVV